MTPHPPTDESGPGPVKARPSFASAATITFGASVGVAALSLVNVLIVSRTLGPTGRGELAFLTTIALLSATLASLGVEEASGNIAGLEPRSRRALATNSVVLSGALGGLAVGALLIIIAVFPGIAGGSNSHLRWLAYIAIPLGILAVYLQFLIRADYGFLFTSIASLVAPLATLVGNLVLLSSGRLTVGTAMTTWVVAQLLGTGFLVWFVARRLAGFGTPNAVLGRRMVAFGVKAHGGRVMKTGNYRLDQWLLGAMAGPQELGLYSVAVAWSEALFYLPEALGMVLRPDVVRATPAEALRRSTRVFQVGILLTIPLVIALIVAAPLLCVTIFGEAFQGSVDDLRVLAPGAFGMVALKLLANSLTAQGKPMLANAAIGVAFVATVALDLILIRAHGGLGAAIASTLAYTLGGIAVAIIFVRTLGGRMADLRPNRADLAQLADPFSGRRWRAR